MANFLELIDEGGSTSGYAAYVVDDQSWLGSAHGTNECDTITLDGPACLDAFPDGVIPSGVVLGKITATGKYGPASTTGNVTGNEIQTVTVASAQGGAVVLSFEGTHTAPIAYNATATDVQNALLATDKFDAADVVVTGGPLNTGAVTITFGGRYVGENVSQVTVDNTNLFPQDGDGQVSTPVISGSTTATTGGSLVAGTYSYRVAAVDATGGETLSSVPKAQIVPAGTATNTVTVNWSAVTGAAGYKIYGRTAGTEALIATVGAVATYADLGAIVPTVAPKTQNTTTVGNATGVTATGTQGNTAAAVDGRETPVGHLFTVKSVLPRGTTVARDIPAALYWHGEVVISKLPPNSGYDAAVATALQRIRYV
jgi:hypothetical protein